MNEPHGPTPRAYLQVFAALMVLLIATVGVSYLRISPSLALAIALAIAGTKAVLIMLYFMHLKFSNRLTWIFSSAALVWLGIIMALTLNDYLTRAWLNIPGK